MKHFIYLLCLLFPLSFSLAGCSDDENDGLHENDTGEDGFNINSYRSMFEKNAPGLLPVDFERQVFDQVKQTRTSMLNILPQWEGYRTMTYEDVNFVEIPLTGDVYNVGAWSVQQRKEGTEDEFTMESRPLWNRSFLIIREDTQKDSVSYHMVDVAMENKAFLEDFHFLGADSIGDGFVIFSDLEGRPTGSYRVKDNKRYAVVIDSRMRDDADVKQFSTFSLSHVSDLAGKLTRGYSSDENSSGDDGFGTGNGYVLCAICGVLYNPSREDCGCTGVEIGGGGGGGGIPIWPPFDESIPPPPPPPPPPPVVGGGGTNSGGKPGNNTNKSKGKTIFRNSNMTEANWEIIEDLLDKITKDCMGKGLYNGLVNSLNGKTLSIEFTNNDYSEFVFDGGGITLGLRQVESNVFFHEMWHAYQAYQETESSYRGSTINQDIEAHYAQYLYLRKLPEYTGGKWEEYYTKDRRMIAVAGLGEGIDEKGNLRPNKDLLEFENYVYNVNFIFAETPIYNNSYIYRYDYNRSGLDNFSNLRTLTKNC